MAGLYIHIPFCASRCGYCDFYSTVLSRAGYLDAVKKELRITNYELRESYAQLSTIYVGGGTPSLFAPEDLQSLVDCAAELWDCRDLQEITLEANPEDLTDDYLARLAATDFNRLSVGIQSFDDGLLRKMNRRHNSQRAKEAMREAQRAGFDNISIDLIYGIPGMTTEQWELSLHEALKLAPQHISAYHLSIEPDTAFGKSGLRPIPEKESERQYELLCRRLRQAGYEHYEISNFARPGFRSIHNSGYWNGTPYLGIGPSAHSYDGESTRRKVAADIGGYLEKPTYETEILSDTDLGNERIMVGLRRGEGIPIKGLEQKAQILLQQGLLVKKGDRIAIPEDKWLLSDYIISSLFE